MNPINWVWVGKAVQHYVDNEFTYIEAPWIVPFTAIEVTLPYNRLGFKLGHPTQNPGYLVGSAEQGFIQMMVEGKLSKGKYCAASPCFRDEQEDEWHKLYFFKVELIEVNPNSKNVFEIMDAARALMESLAECKISVVRTMEGYDLMCKGIELGSYGYRQFGDHTWTYGTGLALPRFSQVLELKDPE